jgi:peptide/nickel transport system substrate-binding protein
MDKKFSTPRFLDRFIGYIESVPQSDRLILRLAFFGIIASVIFLAYALNDKYSILTPTAGGEISEGIVGTPRFVNPALALTRADQDVTALVYRGLLKIGADGELQNDIAESVTAAEDGLTYNVILRRDVKFHDSTPLTAHDVAFTIQLIQDADLKSPLRGNWTEVLVEEVGEYELNIILKEAYAPFVENFTVGIMPAHIWSNLSIGQMPFSQLNTEPVGSGPFEVTAARRDATGIITHYTLDAFRENDVQAKLDTIELFFFQNESELIDALKQKEIDATAYISNENIEEALSKNISIFEQSLPRTFGVFFNQNRSSVLRDESARKALTMAINRDALIEKTLFGHGVPIETPTTFGSAKIESQEGEEETEQLDSAEQAVQILEDGGWLKNNAGFWEKEIDGGLVTLSITVKTSNSPLFSSLVESIAAQWQAIGVEVSVEQYEQTGLVQSVIRTRDFQALLFGLDMNRTQDLYPFWHSSQRDDPGLNIAEYTNLTVDRLLEAARTEQDTTVREEYLAEASQTIAQEMPAIFLFQPTMTYLVQSDITISPMRELGRPADRFTTIANWHTESESLWPIFRTDLE